MLRFFRDFDSPSPVLDYSDTISLMQEETPTMVLSSRYICNLKINETYDEGCLN